MTKPNPIRTAHTRTTRLRPMWVLPLLAVTLGAIVIVRATHDGSANSNDASDANRARSSTDITYERGRVDLPRGWQLAERTDNVATWTDAQTQDAVTVAAIESSSAPLAAIVADVAAATQRLPATVDVGVPRDLRLTRAARGDAALLLTMTLQDPRGERLHVRQIWRRDTRAARDVVATWTSRDEQWPTSPEDGIPQVAVR